MRRDNSTRQILDILLGKISSIQTVTWSKNSMELFIHGKIILADKDKEDLENTEHWMSLILYVLNIQGNYWKYD